ncbi:MAG: hypothetical protein ACREBV_01795, partial [Candidatus Zixiibacteriota bacterium]
MQKNNFHQIKSVLFDFAFVVKLLSIALVALAVLSLDVAAQQPPYVNCTEGPNGVVYSPNDTIRV